MKASRELAINIVAGDKSCYGADDPSKYGACHHLQTWRSENRCGLFGVRLIGTPVDGAPYKLSARCADCRAAEVKE